MAKVYLRVVRATLDDPTMKHAAMTDNARARSAIKRFEILSEQGELLGELAGVSAFDLLFPLSGAVTARLEVLTFAEDFEGDDD